MSKEISETAQKVLEKRYFLEGETEWKHLTKRVGRYFGQDEEESNLFRGVMDNLDFLPNSPCLMNAGTEIKAYSACYVLPVEDSIESIYKFYSDAALISKSGGGVGANYSSIRASGTPVNSTDGVASGPLSFMSVQDVSTDIIKQGGRRRGANISILSCDHPDIWDFIKAKDTPGTLENFNLSVGITDEFMACVRGELSAFDEGGDDTSYFENTALWRELTERAWSSAEPGVLFMDTIEKGNPVPHLGKLEATNP
jgi:ribonucleoside-diphosphate reductase alpha chain